jgi:NAD(P)-dependent dehydrogenase (short-subunit alcohol dehydrogenase family)
MKNKIAFVTGGGSGIGAAICVTLAKAGVGVAVAGRTRAKCDAVAQTIHDMGGHAAAVEVDVSQSASVRAAVDATMAHFGRLDIVVNNAGISPVGSVTDISEEEWNTCIAIDLTSVFLVCKYAIPHLTGGGSIINVAGTFGIRAAPQKAAYSAAKAGVVNLTRAIALDHARQNIRCNVVCPGFVDTPLTASFSGPARDAFLERYQPLPGMTQPEDVASLVGYLASDQARMITGQTFVIDAGQQAGLF